MNTGGDLYPGGAEGGEALVGGERAYGGSAGGG